MLVLLLTACHGEPADSAALSTDVTAIVDPRRGEHYFDVPFPSDTRMDAALHPDLDGFPQAIQPLAAGIVEGWAERARRTTQGYANNGAAYFRFEGALDLPATTEGTPDDPVVLVAMDGSEQLPLFLRFVADPEGDPFYGTNTLAMVPALGNAMRSGATYAAVVMQSAGVAAPADYTLPTGVVEALSAAGVMGEPAVATVFTVADATGELRQLFADADDRVAAAPPSLAAFKRVVRVSYRYGETPSGREATVFTATFEDGTTNVAYLEADTDNPDHTIDLVDDWPMAVYEGVVPTWNYQGLDDRPYMSPGLGHIDDVDRYTGWITFEGGTLASEPELEDMRVVVSIPKDADGNPRADVPFVLWDHGTSGHAYNSVQRRNPRDRGHALADTFANAGWAVIGRDAALYGTRYPLIDEGFGGSLGFYNIVNAPAFRDNQRQTVVDGHILLRAIESGAVNAALPAGSLDTQRRVRFGHSLGSVTANQGMAAEPDAFEAGFLSGSGGIFTHYFLDTGLLPTFDPTVLASLFALVGQDVPDDVTATAALGAILGLDEAAWAHVDRMHPAVMLFQWQMDPSDPMSVGRDEALPTHMIVCTGDWQVPNFTSDALLAIQPQSTSFVVDPSTDDYDPHACLHREDAGIAGLADWLAGLP